MRTLWTVGRGIARVGFLGLLALVVATTGPCRAQTDAPGPQKEVEVGIFLVSLYELNFVHGNYKVTFWSWFKSRDEAFNPVTGIEIAGARDVKVMAQETMRLPDGRFYHAVKYAATVGQTWDLRWYPFDRQTIRLVLECIEDTADERRFVADRDSSRVNDALDVPGWRLLEMTVRPEAFTYKTDFGTGIAEHLPFSRIGASIDVERLGNRVAGTSFLGFLVANVLTGTTLAIESFAGLRTHVPFIGRLNLVVGSLFGAVGNKYIVDNALPPMPVLSLPDFVQISSFGAITVALLTTITTQAMGGIGYAPAVVSTTARTIIGAYLAGQIGLTGYFISHLSD